jgi:hypothetical protein
MENNKFGFVFGFGMRTGGFIFSAFGLLLFLRSIIMTFTEKFEILNIVLFLVGLILLLLGGLLSFTQYGVLIDYEKRRFKEYSKYINMFVQGEWKSIENYSLISLLSFNKGTTTYSQSNRALTLSEIKHEVYLLNEKQTDKKLINSFVNKDEAKRYVDYISTKLNLTQTNYSPPMTNHKRHRK